MTLIEVLVVSVILMITSLASISMINTQMQQSKNLANKLEALNYEQILSRVLVDDASCLCIFGGTTVPSNGGSVSLAHLRNGCQTGTTNDLLTTGKALSPTSNLIVSSISLTNFKDIGNSNRSADLLINFSNSGAPIAPIQVPSRLFRVSSGEISGCLGEASAITRCADANSIFIGIGKSFNGQVADQNGCVSYISFKGEVGQRGLTGERGTTGERGIAGISGDKGDKGDVGVTGATGLSGANGDKGDKGDTGADGIKGANGLNGANGLAGVNGDKGDKGDKGDTGAVPSGVVTGSAACHEYTSDYNGGKCTGHCGNDNDSDCPSTWRFAGTATSGGCLSPNIKHDTAVNESHAVIGFICLTP